MVCPERVHCTSHISSAVGERTNTVCARKGVCVLYSGQTGKIFIATIFGQRRVEITSSRKSQLPKCDPT